MPDSADHGYRGRRWTAIVWLRVAVAFAIVVAVTATFIETAGRVAINPFNFFGYFTVQSNLIGCVVLMTAAFAGAIPSRFHSTIAVARGCATTYLLVVGVVYAVLLAPLGAAGGVPLAWANVVLHVVVPVYFAVDWVISPELRRLPWRRFWILPLYPVLWCLVVLVRGATDGWVPYPFLDPATGYGSVAVFVAIITIVVSATGAGVWASSRLSRLDRKYREPAAL